MRRSQLYLDNVQRLMLVVNDLSTRASSRMSQVCVCVLNRALNRALIEMLVVNDLSALALSRMSQVCVCP